MTARLRAEVLAGLPPEWPDDPLPEIRARLARDRRVVVILDDDPTGTQTVHDVPVVTVWDEAELTDALRGAETLLYVLTNSRSLHGPDAAQVATRLGVLAARAGRAAGREVVVGIRGDSTLRGHFPIENLAVQKALATERGGPAGATLLVPFFGEGGRLTIDGVHYVTEGELLVPAGETEFARDAAFGYRSSYLPDWVEEKSGGQLRAADVVLVPLTALRSEGPRAVARRLSGVRSGQVVVSDGVSYRDVEVLALGLLEAEQAGRSFVYRTAASFYRARGGQGARALLTSAELLPGMAPGRGGLVVVGSHVQRSSEQLERLLALPGIAAHELAVPELLDAGRRDGAIRTAREHVTRTHTGTTPADAVVYTSRQRADGSSAEHSLGLARRVSDALVELVRGLEERPRFLVAKGGITSSDLGTRALGVRRARVPGQVAPGVPVWVLGAETAFPGLPFVVFPGNVGSPDTLSQVVLRLRGE